MGNEEYADEEEVTQYEKYPKSKELSKEEFTEARKYMRKSPYDKSIRMKEVGEGEPGPEELGDEPEPPAEPEAKQPSREDAAFQQGYFRGRAEALAEAMQAIIDAGKAGRR